MAAQKESKDTISEEYLEMMQQRSHLVGESSGLAEASEHLRKVAASAFLSGRDKEAELLRFWANRFGQDSKERHPLKTCEKCSSQHYPEDHCMKR